MEDYAKKNRVPIMMSDGICYLCDFIRKHHITRILEIGTAIGYSAIRMAMVDENIHVTTIEKDESRYLIALENIRKCHLEGQIDAIYGDALEVDIVSEFDLIFIDASKGHNVDFFLKFQHLLPVSGFIVTDNLAFHGLVDDESKISSKNQRGIVRKIKLFIDFLNNNSDFETVYVSVGDRISISKKVVE